MERTSFRGNRMGITLICVLALSMSTAAGTYRLKKSAEIHRWEKTYELYSQTLEKENLEVIKGSVIAEAK